MAKAAKKQVAKPATISKTVAATKSKAKPAKKQAEAEVEVEATEQQSTSVDLKSTSVDLNIAHNSKKSKSILTMADLLASQSDQVTVPQKGQVIKGTVTKVDRRVLYLDIGAKTEGVVTDREFAMAKDYIVDLKPGDKLDAVVVSEDGPQGQVLLSLKRAAFDSRWEVFEDALKNNQVLEAKGIDVNKGGLIVLVHGVRGFVPSSQFGHEWMGKFTELKGRTFSVRAIEVDREKNRLIFSERHVSEENELAQKEAASAMVKSGEVYDGVVSGVMHFGLFVTVEVPLADKSLGHVEGLVHISEISWEKVAHPKEYHKVGDKLKVMVLGFDERTDKLNLSIKQLSGDPWVGIDAKYPPNTTVTGKVTRVESFGVFVNVEPGVDGLLHNSKLDSQQSFKRGDNVSVNVESVSPEQRRMSLSLVMTQLPVEYR